MFFIGVDLLLDGVGHHVGDDIGRENQVHDESFRRRKSDAENFIQLYSYKVGQRLELITKGDATLGVAFARLMLAKCYWLMPTRRNGRELLLVIDRCTFPI